MKPRSSTISTTHSVTVEEAGSAPIDGPFRLLLLLLLLDYGRPQSFFPVVDTLHPGMIIQAGLFLYLISRTTLNLNCAQTKCFIFLILIMAIHVPIATNNFWAFQMFQVTILYFIVYLSVINFVNSYEKLERFIDSWIIINLVCAIIGIYNGGKIPNSSFMGDENDFALVMTMAIPFAYFMSLHANRFKSKLLYLSAVGVFVAANVASLSRGGFIGLATVGLFCWLKSPRKILSATVVTLMAGVLYLSAPPTYWNEVNSIQNENIHDGTGQVRWYSWQCGWKMFLDNPVIGVGQGNFPWNFEAYEPSEGLADKKHGGRAAHSIYFTLVSELGATGTILFFSLLYSCLRDMKVILEAEGKHRVAGARAEMKKDLRDELKQLKFIILGVQGALLGYLVSGVFLSVLYYPHFWLLIALSLAIANVGKRYSQWQT